MPHTRTRTLTRVALFAAVIAILAQFAIPLPSGVPATLQTFAIALAGYTLGTRHGTLAMCVYLLIGAVGVPVFANLKGGAAVLFGVTGGFLWGFILLAALCGWGISKSPFFAIALGIVGLVACHLTGLLQFSAITGTPMAKAFFLASLPFILKDVLSVALAYVCARALRTRLSF